MAWTDHPKVVAVRSRSRVVDVAVETLAGFSKHETGRNGAVLTYYGFLTLFPLFLAASTILGFILESKPEWRVDLVDSAAAEIPFIGDKLGGEITGSWVALTIGVSAAVWGSLKAFIGLQIAYDDTWEIDRDDRAGFVTLRTRALIGLAVIGAAQTATIAIAGIISQADLPRVGQILVVLGGLVINIGVAAAMYSFLTSSEPTWAMVWPGAIFTGVLYTIIQLAGTALLEEINKSEAYGEIGGVLGLLSWLSLHAIINLFGAEINAALDRLRRDDEPHGALDSPMIEAPLADT